MGTIESHITALVHLYDCVIVPGMGAFVGNYKPAEIVEEKGLFLPPKKEIGFNRSLMHNDGLLCDFVARREGIAFSDAQKRIEEFVSQSLIALANKQPVVIDEVGELKKDAMGNILFWPNASSLFLPESFGLGAFHFNVPQLSAAKHSIVHRNDMPQVWLRRLVQKRLVAGITLFAGLFLLATEFKMPESVSMGSLAPSIVAEVTLAQPETNAEGAEAENDELQSELLNVDTVVANNEETAPKVLFYLIAASFPENEAAEKFKSRMVDSGYALSEVVSLNGKNRVAIEKFTDRAAAFSALENFRQIKGFESVWLLKNK